MERPLPRHWLAPLLIAAVLAGPAAGAAGGQPPLRLAQNDAVPREEPPFALEPLPPAAPPAASKEVPQSAPPPETASPPADEGLVPAPPRSPLRIGMVPGGDVRRLLAALQPFRSGLAAALDRPVEILTMSSYRALIDAQILQRIDVGFYSTAAYATAAAICRCVEPLVAPAAPDGTIAYHGIIVVGRNAPFASVADLAGAHVAAAGADSVGGRRLQLAGLAAEGIDPQRFFGRIEDAGSAVDAVRLLVAGGADAAFAWSSLQGDPQSGYSRGTLALLAGSGEIVMNELSVLWRSPALAHGPVAVASTMTEPEKQAIEAFLVGLFDSDPPSYELLDRRYGGGFRPVDAKDYASAALLLADLPPPQAAPAEKAAEPDAAPAEPPAPAPAP